MAFPPPVYLCRLAEGSEPGTVRSDDAQGPVPSPAHLRGRQGLVRTWLHARMSGNSVLTHLCRPLRLKPANRHLQSRTGQPGGEPPDLFSLSAEILVQSGKSGLFAGNACQIDLHARAHCGGHSDALQIGTFCTGRFCFLNSVDQSLDVLSDLLLQRRKPCQRPHGRYRLFQRGTEQRRLWRR